MADGINGQGLMRAFMPRAMRDESIANIGMSILLRNAGLDKTEFYRLCRTCFFSPQLLDGLDFRPEIFYDHSTKKEAPTFVSFDLVSRFVGELTLNEENVGGCYDAITARTGLKFYNPRYVYDGMFCAGSEVVDRLKRPVRLFLKS